jgi:hypothetical protein
MRKDQREASLNKIKTSRSTRVILISFKAGSTGTWCYALRGCVLIYAAFRPQLDRMQQRYLV